MRDETVRTRLVSVLSISRERSSKTGFLRRIPSDTVFRLLRDVGTRSMSKHCVGCMLRQLSKAQVSYHLRRVM